MPRIRLATATKLWLVTVLSECDEPKKREYTHAAGESVCEQVARHSLERVCDEPKKRLAQECDEPRIRLGTATKLWLVTVLSED